MSCVCVYRTAYWRSLAGGTVIELHIGSKSCVLQGDDAVAFLERAEQTNERFTDADLVLEYEEVTA